VWHRQNEYPCFHRDIMAFDFYEFDLGSISLSLQKCREAVALLALHSFEIPCSKFPLSNRDQAYRIRFSIGSVAAAAWPLTKGGGWATSYYH
jgi:hypothetical protein